jgi:DNA-binding CsgD family transcriptional regulator
MRDAMYFGPTAATEVETHRAGGRAEAASTAFEHALEEVVIGDAYGLYVARLYARGICAYADVAELARARGDSGRVAGIEGAAASAIERFDAMLQSDNFPDGDPPPSSLAHRAVVEAETSRLRGRSDADSWKQATERWTDLEEPLELAYAEWRLAEALLLAGAARGEASSVLSRAADTAREVGAVALLAQIASLARRARVPLSGAVATEASDPPEQRFGLTDRELEVLALLAEGLTNREIGERLFMSEKTASVHVSRILTKLDVRGRVEAATMAQRLGLAQTAPS